ncbi:hypothetical protein DFH27DRAFT_528869 [Peziza echinospora]|nr:hypothetical protein DFH27DRAFT_528869 [Peziza echinospora]
MIMWYKIYNFFAYTLVNFDGLHKHLAMSIPCWPCIVSIGLHLFSHLDAGNLHAHIHTAGLEFLIERKDENAMYNVRTFPPGNKTAGFADWEGLPSDPHKRASHAVGWPGPPCVRGVKDMRALGASTGVQVRDELWAMPPQDSVGKAVWSSLWSFNPLVPRRTNGDSETSRRNTTRETYGSRQSWQRENQEASMAKTLRGLKAGRRKYSRPHTIESHPSQPGWSG